MRSDANIAVTRHPCPFRNQKIGITITTTAVYTIALITFPPAGSFLFSIIFGLGSQGGSGSLTGRPVTSNMSRDSLYKLPLPRQYGRLL